MNGVCTIFNPNKLGFRTFACKSATSSVSSILSLLRLMFSAFVVSTLPSISLSSLRRCVPRKFAANSTQYHFAYYLARGTNVTLGSLFSEVFRSTSASYQCSSGLILGWGSGPDAVNEKGFVPVFDL